MLKGCSDVMNFATGQGFVKPDLNGKLNWNKKWQEQRL